jgi:hypothetical protein
MHTEPTITLRLPRVRAQQYAEQIEAVCPELSALLRILPAPGMKKDEPSVDDLVRRRLESDGFFPAVKLYRELNRASIADAAHAVEAMRDALAKSGESPRRLIVGDEVSWVSQAGGHSKRKAGRVVQVVPPKAMPCKKFADALRSSGLPRKEESYVVQVGKKLYWPRVNLLSLVE